MNSSSREVRAATRQDDNTYRAVQRRLRLLGEVIEYGATEVKQLMAGTEQIIRDTDKLADQIERADLDPKYVGLTRGVSSLLVLTRKESKSLHDLLNDLASDLHNTADEHKKRYGRLDAVRTGRQVKTPKPGFFPG